MATATNNASCIKCRKAKSTLKCTGCAQDFCSNHLNDHRQELNQQFDEIELNTDLFRQTLNEQTNNSFIQQINQWEKESINKIQQIANQCRHLIIEQTNKNIQKIEIDFNKLTNEIKEVRQENDFNEIDINEFNQKLKQLQKQIDQPSTISIQQDSTSSFINEISVVILSENLFSLKNVQDNTKWKQFGLTVAGGNREGNQLNQLASPLGIYVNDNNQTIYISDYDNHRIVQWEIGAQTGQFVVAGGNGKGNRMDQLNNPTDLVFDQKNDSFIICDQGNRRIVRWPRRKRTNQQIIISNIDCWGLAMDNNGDLYVSDYVKNEVRRWREGETKGTIVAGGHGKGKNFNQLNTPRYIFVDEDYSVYVSDNENHRVMKWMKDAREGIVVAGGQGPGKSLRQIYHPNGVTVDHSGNVYVADLANHRIMRWLKDAKEGSIIAGGNGKGQKLNQLNYPMGVSFNLEGNFYVVDQRNHRVQKFDVDFN